MRYAFWGEGDVSIAGENFFDIDGEGRGIWIKLDTIDFDFDASIELKTSSGNSAEVTVSAVAFTEDGRMINLSQELNKPGLSKTQTISGGGTNVELSVKDIKIGKDILAWTLRVECDEPVETSSASMRLAGAGDWEISYAEVSKPTLEERPDDDSSYGKSIVTWDSNNLDVPQSSDRVPFEYVAHLSDVGARLKKDIDLDYVVVIANVTGIEIDSSNAKDDYEVRMTLWSHKGENKEVIGRGSLLPNLPAQDVIPVRLEILSAEMRHRRLEDETSFSVTISASHKTELGFVSLYMLPEKPLMFRGH